MLKPSYLEQLPARMIELYSEVEMQIIAYMAERIAAQNYFIPSVQWQYQKLIEMGNFHNFIADALAAQLGVTRAEIEYLMEEAGQKALAFDTRIYKKAGLKPPTIASSPALTQVLKAGYDNTSGLFDNLTRTTANTATKQFEHALDKTWLNINSGAFDYNSAIRMAVKDLTDKGLKSVEYPSGRTDYLDVAVRRATVTGVNQTALKIQDKTADELGSDLVETTAHSGARPSHAEWQGKVFSRSGTNPKYPHFATVTGYGTGAGLGGWNCRHSFFPFFEGMEPVYTQAELDEMNAKKYEYNGEKLTEYEATQKQRGFERNIRKYKREFKGMESAGQPTEESASKLRSWQEKQKDFINQTGLKRQYHRENIFQTVDKPLESGIMKESSKKSITKITDSAIDRVPKVEVSGYSNEQNLLIQQQHKELLKFARDNNDSNEVAFVFDRDLKNRKEYMGTDDRLDFGGALYGKDLFVMHNHPRNSSYSKTDIIFFQESDTVRNLSIIKNNGTIETLTKTTNYDKIKLKQEYDRLRKKIVKQGSDAEHNRLIRTLLLKSKSGIIWRKFNE